MSTQEEKSTIQALPDGPYLVKNLKHLVNQHGEVDTKATVALCRCGGSANKPFCDGTHAKNSFSSAKETGRLEDKLEDYQGEQITIHDNRSVCAHSGVCTDGLAAVFRLRQEPWIDPNGASREEIIAIIEQCPSGALSYSVDTAVSNSENGEPTIFIAPNGPYAVSDAPQLLDERFGKGATQEKFTLCRCGGSKNKPFCDGSHWSNGFTDDKN